MNLKTEHDEDLSRITAALSSPVRLMMVDVLAQSPRGVDARCPDCAAGISCLGAAIPGLLLSVVLVAKTRGFARQEASQAAPLPAAEVFRRTTLTNPTLSSACQAGFVNNLNDGMVWGLLPMVLLTSGLSSGPIGALAVLYPAAWGIGTAMVYPSLLAGGDTRPDANARCVTEQPWCSSR